MITNTMTTIINTISAGIDNLNNGASSIMMSSTSSRSPYDFASLLLEMYCLLPQLGT